MYLSWSAFYEGSSDAQYFNVLIPRLLEDILRKCGKRPCEVGEDPAVQFGGLDRRFEDAADAICSRKAEFHIIFIHSDLGGRAQGANVSQRREALVNLAHQLCDFNQNLAVMLSPKKELESWALADASAIREALGVKRIADNLLPNSPKDAERILDPKATLEQIVKTAGARKGTSRNILVRIAQEQNLSMMRRAPSFLNFEESLMRALTLSGFIDPQKAKA